MLRALAVGILISILLLMAAGFVAMIAFAWTLHWLLGLSLLLFFVLIASGQWASDYLEKH